MAGDSDDNTTYIYFPATSTRKFVAETTTRARDHAAKPVFSSNEQAAIIRRGKDTSSSSASSPAREAPAVPKPANMTKHAKHTLSGIPPLPPGYEEYADQIFSPPMVTVHICRICLRPRSDRYHREHPIAPGKIPPPATICRRCRVTTPDQEPKQAKLVRVTESNPVKIGLSGILPNATISRPQMEEEKRKSAKTTEAFHKNFVPVSKQPGKCSKLILYRHVSPEEVLGKARDLRSSSPSEDDKPTTRKSDQGASKKSDAIVSRDVGRPQAASDVETQVVVHAKKESPPAVTYTESAIRRIAREEVERYRQAERRILAHPQPYARGRLVPAEAHGRRRETSPPASDVKGLSGSAKNKTAAPNAAPSRQHRVEATDHTAPAASARPPNSATNEAARGDTRWWPKDVPSLPSDVKPSQALPRTQTRYPYKDDTASHHSRAAKRSGGSQRSETGESRKARLEAVYEPTPEETRPQMQPHNSQDARTDAWSKETIRSIDSDKHDDEGPRRRTRSRSHSDRPDMVVEHVSLPSYREPVDQQKHAKESLSRSRSSQQADNASDWTDREYWENDNTVRSASQRINSARSQNPHRVSRRSSGAAKIDKQSMLATVSEESHSAKTDRTASRAQQAHSNAHKVDMNQNLTGDDEGDGTVSWEYRLRTVEPIDGQAEQTRPAAEASTPGTQSSRHRPRDAIVYHSDKVIITQRKPAVDSDFRSSSVRFAPVVHITPTPPNSDDYPQSNDKFVEQRSQRRAERRQESYAHEPSRAAHEEGRSDARMVEGRSRSGHDDTSEGDTWPNRHGGVFHGVRSESPHREWRAAGLKPDPLTVGGSLDVRKSQSSRPSMKQRGAIQDREHTADPIADFDRHGPYREEVPTASMMAITGSSRSSRMPESSFRSR